MNALEELDRLCSSFGSSHVCALGPFETAAAARFSAGDPAEPGMRNSPRLFSLNLGLLFDDVEHLIFENHPDEQLSLGAVAIFHT
jgi:hypothetical protein